MLENVNTILCVAVNANCEVCHKEISVVVECDT
jgi:hypothetical protein